MSMSREALAQMRAEKELEILPGVTHLFEETGKLEEVARPAAGWFTRHLGSVPEASADRAGSDLQ